MQSSTPVSPDNLFDRSRHRPLTRPACLPHHRDPAVRTADGRLLPVSGATTYPGTRGPGPAALHRRGIQVASNATHDPLPGRPLSVPQPRSLTLWRRDSDDRGMDGLVFQPILARKIDAKSSVYPNNRRRWPPLKLLPAGMPETCQLVLREV